MSLYNSIFGMNTATVLLAPMLTEENPTTYFPRFRDCYVEDGNIVIYTRVGGGNRFESHGDPEWDFGESKLYELPTFIETYDDDFDSTYGYYVFGVPEEWRADFEHVMAGELSQLSEAYLERIAKCFGSADGISAFEIPSGEKPSEKWARLFAELEGAGE